MSNPRAIRTRKPRLQAILLGFLLVFLVVNSGLVISITAGANDIPTFDFVSLPTTSSSSKGIATMFANVATVYHAGVARGIKGYLKTASGTPVAGARVYTTYLDEFAHEITRNRADSYEVDTTYFYEFAYRTQATTTTQNGFFEVLFPMNWTGRLPLTLIYFGGTEHQGLKQVFSLRGEHL